MFMHPSDDGHLDGFHFGVACMYIYLHEYLSSVLLGTCLGVELLGRVIFLFNVLKNFQTIFFPFLPPFKHFYLFIYFYFWLCWVFSAARGLSPAVASRGYTSCWCEGFSLWWLLLVEHRLQ